MGLLPYTKLATENGQFAQVFSTEKSLHYSVAQSFHSPPNRKDANIVGLSRSLYSNISMTTCSVYYLRVSSGSTAYVEKKSPQSFSIFSLFPDFWYSENKSEMSWKSWIFWIFKFSEAWLFQILDIFPGVYLWKTIHFVLCVGSQVVHILPNNFNLTHHDIQTHGSALIQTVILPASIDVAVDSFLVVDELWIQKKLDFLPCVRSLKARKGRSTALKFEKFPIIQLPFLPWLYCLFQDLKLEHSVFGGFFE